MRHYIRYVLPGSLLAALAVAAMGIPLSSYGAPQAAATHKGPGIPAPSHINAGGKAPAGVHLIDPFRGQAAVVKAGKGLFTKTHCSGCHGPKGGGLIGPSLSDQRWIFGGSDEEIFDSIFYGRPNGMPAFGGLLGVKNTWVLVTYLESLQPPKDEPTESWTSSSKGGGSKPR